MAEKVLLNIKDDVYNRFFISYIGARQMSLTITRSTLMSQMVQNSIEGRDIVLRDARCKLYTQKELFNLGVTTIKNFFDYFFKIHDNLFYCIVMEYDYNGKSFSELDLKSEEDQNIFLITLLKEQRSAYMTNYYMVDAIAGNRKSPNISESDYDILVKVIRYTESPHINYSGIREEYYFGKEITKLINRAKLILIKNDYNNILTDIIIKEYESSPLKSNYSLSISEVDYGNYEKMKNKIALYEDFMEYLKKNNCYIDIYNKNKDDLEISYANMKVYGSRKAECKQNCKQCFFHKDNCYAKWFLEDVESMLINILDLKVLETDDFAIMHFNKKYNIEARKQQLLVEKIK